MLTDRELQQLRNEGRDDVADEIVRLRAALAGVVWIAEHTTDDMTDAGFAALQAGRDALRPNVEVEARKGEK